MRHSVETQNMCGRGTLWSYEGDNALAALKARPSMMQVLRRHAGWDVDHTAAESIYTELVANVARHAPGHIRASVECDGDTVALSVEDAGSGFNYSPKLPTNVLSEGGRGLFIVSNLAAEVRLGSTANGGSKIVATLPRVFR